MDQGSPLKKIPLLLISGFLGSGKTSLLKNILQLSGSDLRINIIQNEFAPGKSDSTELLFIRNDLKILDVNKGSVFCSCLLSNFIPELSHFLTQHPADILILESTGLADPLSIGQILDARDVSDQVYLAGVWTVIDAIHFDKSLKFLDRVKRQIQIADLLILNKTDQKIEKDNLISEIRKWNTSAPLVEATFGHFNSLNPHFNQILNPDYLPDCHKNTHKESASGRPDIHSCVYRSRRIIPEEKIRKFWITNRDKIYRMKGFVRISEDTFRLVHSTFDDLNIEATEIPAVMTELILIGPGIRGQWVTQQLNN